MSKSFLYSPAATWLAAVAVVLGIGLAVFRRDLLWLGSVVPADAENYVNTGGVCVFVPSFESRTYVAAIGLEGNRCLSSSCTDVYLREANVFVSQLTYSLHFNSRFAFRDYARERRACTADCSAVQGFYLQLGPLAPGLYSVWLGTTWLGQIELTEGGVTEGRGCVSSSQPSGYLVPSTPVPPVVTTPQPYPVPGIVLTAAPTTVGYP